MPCDNDRLGNSHDNRKFRRLVKRLREALLVPKEQIPTPPPPKQSRWGFLSAATFVSLLWAYRATTGVTDMDTARGILVIAWIVGVFGIVTLSPIWGRPLRHRFAVGFVMSIVIAFALVGFDWWIVKHFVVVKPDREFTLSEPYGPVKTTLYVNNRADDPAYSVWVKVAIVTPGVLSTTAHVEIDDRTVPSEPNPFSDALAIPTARWFSGFDRHGAECLFVWFPSVPQHTTYHIEVVGEAPSRSSAKAGISGFTLVPGERFSKSGTSGSEMRMFEPMNFRSVGLQVVERKQ